jgi:hypothetical protein
MVAPRDQYLVINQKIIEASDSPTGNKITIIAAKSQDNLEFHPENTGIIRANAYITGWYIEEIGPNEC